MFILTPYYNSPHPTVAAPASTCPKADLSLFVLLSDSLETRPYVALTLHFPCLCIHSSVCSVSRKRQDASDPRPPSRNLGKNSGLHTHTMPRLKPKLPHPPLDLSTWPPIYTKNPPTSTLGPPIDCWITPYSPYNTPNPSLNPPYRTLKHPPIHPKHPYILPGSPYH